jgi:large repetitive protein
MKRLILFSIFSFVSLAASSQLVEICNNGIDDDFDGFIDCYDGTCANSPSCAGIFLGNDATCQSKPAKFPDFSMTLDFASPDETTNHFSQMSIGDLDRDGIPEIVTMNRYTRTLYILNGNNGTVKRKNDTIRFEPYWGVAIANLDNDACAETYFVGYLDLPEVKNVPTKDGVYLFVYDCQLNFLNRTAQALPTSAGFPVSSFGIADFDGDGQEELYFKDIIFDAKTLRRIVKSSAADFTEINGAPVAANMVGNINQELVLGLFIYQVNLGTRAADVGSLTLLKSRSDYFIKNEYNATSIADYNLDGFLDVLASGSTGSHGVNATVFFWDVKNDTIKTYIDDSASAYGSNGWKNGTGRLNVADLDGDGKMNVSYVSGKFLYALNEKFLPMKKTTTTPSVKWGDGFGRIGITEQTSGYTGCTLFDFNGDGASEIVYRDERSLYIINGITGTVVLNPDGSTAQQPCLSRTNFEYPIVADVDADGSTEICVTCATDDTQDLTKFYADATLSRYAQVRVFKAGDNLKPWVPARRVWNQHGYFVVNVNDDLTIPKVLQPHQLVWSTGSCTTGANRPLNKFLNQSPFLNSKGCPTYAAVNLTFSSIKPTIIPPTCPNLNFTVSLQITNLGDVSLSGSVPISFYTSNPKRAGATKITTILVPLANLGTNGTYTLTNQVIAGVGSDSLYIVLNDAGITVPTTPIKLPNGTFFECDYTDNIIGVKINPIPIKLTALKVKDSDLCLTPANGAARAFVSTAAGGENTVDYDFYWSKGAVAKPIATVDFTGPIYSGIPGGTYTVYARHKTAGCNSDTARVVVGSIPTIPSVSISVVANQSECSPPNGELLATVLGGNAGFTFEWFDIALTPLGISGPTAKNLTAGNYLVRVTKAGCSVSAVSVVAGPQVPDAQAKVLQNVVDCSNPNSGSVQADALVGVTVQNPANYTFDWYFYNNATSTRGSILPPANGTGQIRTGLAVGYYQAVIKDNATRCISGQTPIVQVISQTILPTASITEVSPQTSCDPTKPNGVLSATGVATGLTSPTNFTFEWFKGDNTLPVNKVTTVSGAKGETLNQVSGGGIYYTVKVTTPLNCSATAKFIISENVNVPVLTLAQLTPNSVCDATKATTPYNGSIKATVTFGASTVTLPDPNYSFTWYNGLTVTDPVIAVVDSKNPILSGLKDAGYTAIVQRTDLFCTSVPKTQTVAKATVIPVLSASSTGSNNCNAALTPDGTIMVAVTNTIGGDVFGYQWYSGNAVIAANKLTDAPIDHKSMFATAINVGGPVGAPNPYTVYVLNKTTGCENNTTQFVADNSVIPVLSFTSIVPNSICSPATSFNGSLTAQVNNIPTGYTIADYAFKWYDGNTTTTVHTLPTTSIIEVLNKLDAGFYTVDAKNTKTGCQSAPITNQVPNQKINPIIQMTSTGSHNCDAAKTPDGTATAAITNAGVSDTFTYAWTAVAPASAITVATNNANQPTAIKLGGPTNAPRSYNVAVTNNATGCFNNSNILVADVSAKPTLTLQPFDNTVCDKTFITVGPQQNNGHVDITVVNNNVGTYSGPVTLSYNWFNVAPITSALSPNVTSPTNTTTSLTQLDNAKYAAKVSIAELGCVSDPVIAEVLDNLTPVAITPNVLPSTNCAPNKPGNGTAEVTAVDATPVASTTDYAYEWFNGPTVSGAAISSNVVLGTNLQGTSTYTVQVTKKTNGCRSNVAMTVVDAKMIPTISVSKVQDNTVCDFTSLDPNGALLATPASAGTNFTINWIGGTAPATIAGVNGVQFIKLKAGSYSANVTNNDTGCQSANDTQTIIDNLTYPVIAVTPTPQTTCAGTPNGKLVATGDGSNNTTLYAFDWSDIPSGLSHLVNNDGAGTISILPSGSYAIKITKLSTGCASSQSNVVSNKIINPSVVLTNSQLVTTCGLSPNGEATTSISGLSALPGNKYDVFYVYTPTGGTYPTDPAVLKASADLKNITDGTVAPPVYGGMAPGYLTALVIDKNTFCESSPNTVPIIDDTKSYQLTFLAKAAAGLCGGGGGGIDVTVERTGTPGNCPSCTFTWYNAVPTNTNINFFTNPPNMGAAVPLASPLVTGEDLGETTPAPSRPPGVGQGTYTLVVLDTDPAHKDCGNYFVEFVPPTNVPTITVVTKDVSKCILPFDGSLNTIQVTGASVLGYTANVYTGTNNTGTLIATTGAVPAKPVNLLTPINLAAGDYFVEVKDNDVANIGCPLGNVYTLEQLAFPPVITLDQIDPNTSCDPLASADGKVKFTVTNDANDKVIPAKNYELTNINPLVVAVPIIIGPSGTSVGPIGGFKPQTYTITVTDLNSLCKSDKVINIPDVPATPSILIAPPTPETFCDPSSNGSASVSLVGGEPTTQFDFTWSKNPDLSGVVFGPTAGLGGTNGELLNRSKMIAPADWAMGGPGLGSGNRTFYVQGVKNATALSGIGCKTEIKEVVIPDQHISPDLTLTPIFNSFCLATALNGTPGDGKITIDADADPITAGPQNALGGFDYAWTNANGILASPQLAQSNNFIVPQLGTGLYQVTATNVTNKCLVVNTVSINPAPYVITINSHNVIDQRICKVDGQIDLTNITIDESAAGMPDISETNATPLTTNYDFKWYKAAAATPNTFNAAPGQELQDAGLAVINGQSLITGNGAGQYALMGAGTYYVVATRKATAVAAGCPVLPHRVDVKDVHENPIPLLKAFSNTSCLPIANEGEIEINITDATAGLFGPFTYTYTWIGPGPIPATNPGTGNGNGSSADLDNDHYKNLIDDPNPYTVTIENIQSGCKVNASATITKNATPIFVQNVKVVDQVLCGPDGSLTVATVTLNDRDGNTQVFNNTTTPNISDFEFDWKRNASAFTQTTPGTTLGIATYNTAGFGGVPLGFDSYTVTARRITGGPGAGCPSAPFKADILDKRIFPVVSVTPLANTSCAPSFFEGEVKVKVTDASVNLPAPLAGAPYLFKYEWTASASPATLPIGTITLNNDGDGFGGGENDGLVVDNDFDHPKLLKEGVYTVSVTNIQTNCPSTGTTTIFKNSTPVFTQLVKPTPQFACKNAGNLVVDEVQLIDRFNNIKSSKTGDFPLSDFIFTYDRTTIGNTVPGAITAARLDSINYPSIGFDSYYVVATRTTGGPGLNCSSAPYKVDIQDKRLFPKVAFASLANSSCNIALPNGSVTANASEQNGTNTAPYTFIWTLNSGALAPTSTQTQPTNNSSVIANALDGTYVATATNTISGCPIDASFNLQLDQVRSTPNIIDVTSIDPLDCKPSAQAEVTKITLGSQTNSLLFPPNIPPNNTITGAALLNFNYEWYQGGTAVANKLPATTPCIGPGCPIPTTGLVPGKYYVLVQDPTTDCKSGPREVVIKNNQITYPVVTIAQTVKQISCIVTTGTAALAASVVEQSGSTGTYNFAWYPSLDLTGTAIAAPSATNNPNAISNLVVGNYSVEAVNTVTSCKASAFYIVPNDAPTFKPIISVDGQPRTLCVGLDGYVSARVVDISTAYPFPYNFTADLFAGSNPNLNGVPTIPSMQTVPGFTTSFVEKGLAEGPYTVRISDNNTSCTAVDAVIVKDLRKFPAPVIKQIAPVINCDLARPNGVASVTVDGTFIGYEFNWYEGNVVAGLPVYIGAEFGSLKPVLYTVQAKNLISGCTGSVPVTVPSGTLPIPIPAIEKLSDVTSCVSDNGSLSSFVGSDKNTRDYIFDWYDGSTETPPSDFVGDIYTNLKRGTYSVTATSRITGCKSPPKSEVVNKVQVFPDFDFQVRNPSCDKNDGSAILVLLSNVPIAKFEWTDKNGPFQVGPNLTDVVTGVYNVTVTSTLGCATTKDVEIKPEIRPFNGISRNNDGLNEFFKIDCIQDFPNNDVKIFNRAGTLVYEAQGYDNSGIFFDGKSNRGISPMGVNVPDGTYFYIVDKRNGSKPVVGYLEVVN